MTLNKAIEILEIETGSRHEPSDPELYDAQLLGIKALVRLRQLRIMYPGAAERPLPGETEK